MRPGKKFDENTRVSWATAAKENVKDLKNRSTLAIALFLESGRKRDYTGMKLAPSRLIKEQRNYAFLSTD